MSRSLSVPWHIIERSGHGISDLNERTFFNERDSENPEIRDMFKALGIIESFGTGIGEAKRLMRENGSKPKKKVWIETETKDFKQKILDSGYTKNKTQRIEVI